LINQRQGFCTDDLKPSLHQLALEFRFSLALAQIVRQAASRQINRLAPCPAPRRLKYSRHRDMRFVSACKNLPAILESRSRADDLAKDRGLLDQQSAVTQPESVENFHPEHGLLPFGMVREQDRQGWVKLARPEPRHAFDQKMAVVLH
jgi:hypothetical protein